MSIILLDLIKVAATAVVKAAAEDLSTAKPTDPPSK